VLFATVVSYNITDDCLNFYLKEIRMEIIKICGNNGDKKLLEKTARLYCEIWKEPPWNEYFWKQKEVLRDIQEQLKKEAAMLIVAVNKDKVIGFTWGYQIDKKLMEAISNSNLLSFLFEQASKAVFYIDELGVHKKHRMHGIGGKITKSIIKQTKKIGVDCWCLRTHINAVPARKMYSKLGFSDLKIKDGKHFDRTYWAMFQ